MSYDSITNHQDYLSPYYLAEVLPRELKAKDGLRARWAERDKAGEPTPVKGLRHLRREYFRARPAFAEFAQRLAEGEEIHDADRRSHDKSLREQNDGVLIALGYTAAPQVLVVERSGETFEIPVAYAEQNVVAIHCGWATDTDAALDPEQAGQLLDPVEVGGRETIGTGKKLARWLFDAAEPPRYVLLLHGGVIVLADRAAWGEGRYLAVSLDIAIERDLQAELETIAALFSADALQPPAEGGDEQLAQWVTGSRQHSVGVSSELREGLRESVQIIANEVLARLREHGLQPGDVLEPGELARELGRQSLRYLYRILFLLYAEARPELGILPADDEDYIAGYSMQRLGEIASHRLIGEEARIGFHLYESLALLFHMVNDGHNGRGAADVTGLSEGEGLRFESLKADLFDPDRTRLIGSIADPRYDDEEDSGGTAPQLDTRLRDQALHAVLRLLMLAKGSGAKGKTKRGGFISYAQLGINQLGAAYEGLMSYTGFIAAEELYEVAKGGDPKDGSWMIPASQADSYADEVFVMAKDDNGFPTGERRRYLPGSFVYRLAGRDRQVSASYYTPQSLTSVTVELTLQQRIKEEGRPVSAAEVLRWRVCEPALGSGAFLDEAIDQIAALYLKLREEETGERLEPDERTLALQKVKAYIALHNCYGVDLNETAVELAEVSIWLNVMHRGLQAPWFGLHLVRGNSLIGAGRRLYPPEKLAKGQWLKSAPEDMPFSAGAIPDGHIHHFLVPAEGWGCIAGEKEAKELAPEDTKCLSDWRKGIRRSPSGKKSIQRLQALAGRTEYLWSLVIERLRISEREISRAIDVWGAEDLPRPQEAIPRDKVLADLRAPGTPFWRLKTVMDAWCALWFWPVDRVGLLDGSDEVYVREPVSVPVKPEPEPVDLTFPVTYVKASLFDDDEPVQLTLADGAPRKTAPRKPKITRHAQVALKDLEDWLDFAESVLGRQDIPEDSLVGEFHNLADITKYEDQLEPWMGMDSFPELATRFPWLPTVSDISKQQGFFHWELRFAQVFADGGFDIQLGNPPWLKLEWDEGVVLAEHEPWFELVDSPPVPQREARKRELLKNQAARSFFLNELTELTAKVRFFGSVAAYPLLAGTQLDLYRVFMLRTWANIGPYGSVGLIHPDSHLTGKHENRLRRAAFGKLRLHAHFQNRRLIFSEIDWNKQFGMHIYGATQDIDFIHVSWLFDPEPLLQSLVHDGSGEAPGIKYNRTWDLRPHKKRLVRVNNETLARWRVLSGDTDSPVDEVRLLSPVSVDEERAISALARSERRLGDLDPRITRGYDEAGAKKSGLIRWDMSDPGDWTEVILRGPQINIATPIAKQPPNTKHTDKPIDLKSLDDSAVPRTDYRRATDLTTYRAAQDIWFDGRRYSEFYRLAWREMIPASTERSLFPAIIPPGPAHIHGMRSMALGSNRMTALVAGFWSALPLDYALRIGGRGHLDVADARTMPVPADDHPLAEAMLLRTMRLNCLTDAYAPLWEELHRDAWHHDEWAVKWQGLEKLNSTSMLWKHATPLRTERARRAALVELDVLAAMMLHMSADELVALYRSRFPQLVDYESEMWFDANGRKLAANFNQWGHGQTKEHWDQLQRHLEEPERNPPPDGYTPPFYKADRVAEYRQAHAVFSERLRRANAGEGDMR